jgi:hypothetical protein
MPVYRQPIGILGLSDVHLYCPVQSINSKLSSSADWASTVSEDAFSFTSSSEPAIRAYWNNITALDIQPWRPAKHLTALVAVLFSTFFLSSNA